ncbi:MULTISPECIES: tRNA (guanosine(46)-N7)-methyltransferase TrmB [unclassified Ruminococcus]|uniref:tRNA (guanosine(46)-N7)-methyltransferase TrmB n=1 Tax=unclassified Ruminococcus TaxID=2608920 RepID=UPI00210A776D|nr:MULTISPECIES: tRNA (guanosine(46)-N7)-methyltransferase TrmB [unclassified Ruminococcus]MCQ4021991.1 tRNA (guanosine(46)-N7)-methyltransferase TrmB [Ruminococcus sp. zg-924]MCQ4114527.1 tRNA (guanosine(46)-N7)-methyltransferase TrmB [Ruminococcus sp. zg-921]
MRIRKKPWAQPELDRCDFYAKQPTDCIGKWQSKFKKEQPLHLELGCGKGTFVAKCALDNPDINFLAIDIKSDMLGVARRTIVKLFDDNGKSVDNIVLAAYNVEQIDKIISSDDKIERIYINFCNPWPRGKHKKRRLTFPKKLEMYKQFLIPGGEIRFKTDDEELFCETLEYFEQCSLKTTFISRDLHNEPPENLPSGFVNYETEHEKMFTEMGKPTYCCFVTK